MLEILFFATSATNTKPRAVVIITYIVAEVLSSTAPVFGDLTSLLLFVSVSLSVLGVVVSGSAGSTGSVGSEGSTGSGSVGSGTTGFAGSSSLK